MTLRCSGWRANKSRSKTLPGVLVRILPVFAPLRLNAAMRGLLERVLPSAGFLSFLLYIVWTEWQAAPWPAAIGLTLAEGLTLFTRTGLIGATALGSVVYFACGLVWR